MNIDRYMVNLFFEIKRNIPTSMQPAMKISDPAIGETMVSLYKKSKDENIRLLVEIFLERAGDEWVSKIREKKRFYRGNLVAKAPKADSKRKNKPQSDIKKAGQRIYRGQFVTD